MRLSSDIDLGKNEIKNATFEVISTFPSTPFLGQMVLYRQTPLSPAFVYHWNGSTWITGVTSIEGLQGPITKANLGLDRVNNTNDSEKPISTATQSALDNKQPLDSDLTQIAAITSSNDDFIQKKLGSWTNRSVAQVKADLAVTKSDVGLGNLDNTSDVNKPISTATKTYVDNQDATKQPLDADLTQISAIVSTDNDFIQKKAGSWTNRTVAQVKVDLAYTKSDVGLGNIDNTSDVNKPISTATQTALNLKQDSSTALLLSASTPSAETIGVSGSVGVATTAARADHTHAMPSAGVPVSLTFAGTNAAGSAATISRSDHTHAIPTPTKSDVGLGNIDNTSDVNKPISTATQTALNLKQDAATAATLTSSTPAAETLGATGVVGVATTAARADHVHAFPSAGIPVALTIAGTNAAGSAVTLARSDHVHALPAMGVPVSLTFAGANSAGSAVTLARSDHTHAIPTPTKSDVGLGNLDNTSDVNKPVSTATQTALNGKQPLDTDLTAISSLTPTNDDFMQYKAGAWTNRTVAQVKVDLGVSGNPTRSLVVSTALLYNATTTNDIIMMNNSVGTSVILPTPASIGVGRSITVKSQQRGITVTSSGGAQIDNSSNASIANLGSKEFISDGSEWWVF